MQNYFKRTSAGNFIFYPGDDRYARCNPNDKDVFPIDSMGDAPLTKCKVKTDYGSPEGMRKRALARLRAKRITTLGQLVKAYKDDRTILDDASYDTCGRGKGYIKNVLDLLLDKAPGVLDKNYVAPVILPLGFTQITLEAKDLGAGLELSDLSKEDLKNIQTELKTAITEMAVPLLFDAMVRMRTRQKQEAEKALADLRKFAEGKAVYALMDALGGLR